MYLGSRMLNGHNREHAKSHSECVFWGFFFALFTVRDKWHDILLVEPFYDSAIPIMFFNINRSTMMARLRALIKPPAEWHPWLHCGGGEMIGWRKEFTPSVSDAVVWKSIKQSREFRPPRSSKSWWTYLWDPYLSDTILLIYQKYVQWESGFNSAMYSIK